MQGVIDVIVGQIKRHDIPAAGVNADMKLSPGAAFDRPVLFKQPFASAAQFQSGAVDDQVKIAGLVSPGRFHRQSTRPPAQRRMVRDGQVDLQHSHDRTNQPFALAKRQSKHRSQSQRGFDGKVRIMTLTAGVVRGCAFQPAIASGVNQIVRLPRLRRQTSYSRQFVTRRCWRGMRRLPFEKLEGHDRLPIRKSAAFCAGIL